MTGRTKVVPIFAALALVASACGFHSTAGPKPAPGGTSPRAGTRPAQSGTPQSGGGPSTVGTQPTTRPPTGAAYQDHGGVGGMAPAYLRSSPARRLLVEVDYASGRAPAQSALDHLRSILQREAAKPDGVQVEVGDAFAPDRDSYSVQDIQRLEARVRTHYSGGATATLWLVYLNGRLTGGDSVLGLAYEASAAAIFPDQINQATTAIVNEAAIERSVVVHETGHLLGLVNIVGKSDYDHEDPQHPKHSKYKNSVMYWVVDDVSITSLLSGGPPDDYDQFDRADLAALREQ